MITRDRVNVVGHSPVFQILLQIDVGMSIMASPPAWPNSAGLLSTSPDFLIFSALTAAWPCIQVFFSIFICPDLSCNPSIVFGSFWLASPFSGLKGQGSQCNPRLPLRALLAKKFSCCVSYCLVEVSDHAVQISIFIYQRNKRCTSTTFSCLESTHHCWIIQLLKPDSWLGWFAWILLKGVSGKSSSPCHGRFQHLHLGMFWFWQF